MLDEGDDIAAPLAATAIPNLLAGVDREAVGAAALRAWSAALGPAAVQFDPAARDFGLNTDSAGLRDPVATEQFHATSLEGPGSSHVREAVTTSLCHREGVAPSGQRDVAPGVPS